MPQVFLQLLYIDPSFDISNSFLFPDSLFKHPGFLFYSLYKTSSVAQRLKIWIRRMCEFPVHFPCGECPGYRLSQNNNEADPGRVLVYPLRTCRIEEVTRRRFERQSVWLQAIGERKHLMIRHKIAIFDSR